jgi:hypothetical protein
VARTTAGGGWRSLCYNPRRAAATARRPAVLVRPHGAR